MINSNNQIPVTDQSVILLKGVGDEVANRLKRLNIETVQDLLLHFPVKYQDRTRIQPISSLTIGSEVAIEGVILNVSAPFRGKTKFLCEFSDDSGSILLRYFNIFPQLKSMLKPGARARLYGEVKEGLNGFELVHPELKLLGSTPLPPEINLTPTYPLTEGVSQYVMRKITEEALHLFKQDDFFAEYSASPHTTLTLKEAIYFLHRPPKTTDLASLQFFNTPAQKRVIFEELLAHRLSMLNLKKISQAHRAPLFLEKNQLKKAFLNNLPFKLTNAQARVISEIEADFLKSTPMMRLLQGDVGSGKTVVSALSMLGAIENNYQVALMAPTELLAEQHAQQFLKWFSPLNIRLCFLSGNMKTAARRAALSEIASGEAKVIVGTHALFQEAVQFFKLGMIVIDEQHRFGVAQRASLREKGIIGEHAPHQLVMTATPIPRTLAMSFYADLDVSVIDELPPNRTPIQTVVCDQSKRAEILTRVNEACLKGAQVYWVCPLIEESEILEAESAEKTFLFLQKMLPKLKIGLVHGRMKSEEKESAMSSFKKNDTHLLVATTVIEVGVDVPNASLMIIENAERLGLSQLHQLRGRVGRGTAASFCVLLYQSPLSFHGRERLKLMRETTDGFKIAEKDLEIRGPGEVLGTKQTGEVSFRLANFVRDHHLLDSIQRAAETLINTDVKSTQALIHRWIGRKVKYQDV